ncbi:ankyrin repeat-containing protein BDA1-like [Eucalyptus grandis]|uniref:ankyrin repeat-containing protein BDA1-like n=1 Tax=Eucalyptus grandis TaxID=71139 RepID=UPI00192E9CF3|nr:ankyrin repeat-containing protein BDA1-like [Eucalyptus grandis]
MASDLYVAAVKGDVPYLLELLAKDQLLLNKNMTENQAETPLHIAAMLGHLDFVEEILARKAELAKDQDSQGSTPLHLAAAKGYLNIVVSLLRVNPDMCNVCDIYKRNPLHVAAMKGHVAVLEYLVQKRPNAAHSSVEHGQTILHLCLMHNRLEALKFLIDILPSDLINSRDQRGNTILHLAATYGETKTMLFLTNKGVKPNIKNFRGFTALDLLAQGESEERKRKWQNNMHKTLMVVAALLATMAFQATITPPSGLSKGNSRSDKENIAPSASNELSHLYRSFISCNTISFIASLSIVMIFISGLPLKRHRIITWIAMLVTWVAITFMATSYFISVSVSDQAEEHMLAFEIGLVVLAFLFLCHFIRLILKLVRKVLYFVRERWTQRRPGGDAV